MTELFHYTCDHGHAGIGNTGILQPIGKLVSPGAIARLEPDFQQMADLIWLTDLDVPVRDALGLTLGCDRTRFRYRVIDGSLCRWYPGPFRMGLHPGLVRKLEEAPGAMPMHWWISREPVPVEYAPRTAGGAIR